MTDSFTNRLAKEKSPYLQQHAHNPIDWYPWGDEAFQKAKELDRPIFLSIGYSTCHWCHVMEREAFSDVEAAKFLNDNYVSIKVDREEHPEVDSLYMDFAQIIMGGGGGWPLNLILAPDLKPLLAATYLPVKPLRGLPSFLDFVTQVKQFWDGPGRSELVHESDKLIEAFNQSTNATGEVLPTQQTLQEAIDIFFNMADPINGGLKGEPKFPLGFQAEFLLLWSKMKNDSRALYYVTLTLDTMHRGGIYDHLGGGFSRYAVDEEWTIPHFEKMLYDNAILARTYLQAWRATGNHLYKTIAREILDYMLRDLMHEQGGFYSGEDADTGGKEGSFYTWTTEEVKAVINDDDADLFCAFYDVTSLGNYEGSNVLHIDLPVEDFAKAAQIPLKDVEEGLAKAKKLLFEKRQTRPRPIRDEKILTSWNGLAVDTFALAGSILSEPKYTAAALKTVEFLKKELWKGNKLQHRWCGGESRFDGLLEDYAFLIKGLITLFEHRQGEEHLTWALQLAGILERDFKEIEGAFYQTNDNDKLILRKCDFYDGAEPSGNSVHTENLLKLFAITGQNAYLQQAEDILKAAKPIMQQFAPAAFYHLTALYRYLDVNAPTVVIAEGSKGVKPEEIQKLLNERIIPHLITVWKKKDSKLGDPATFPMRDETTLYICRQNRCEPPLTKYEEIAKVIKML
ncbi:MAG: thioredoxin domain-containing protein [Rhabdochlamydiaceae bacterium]